MRNSSHVLVTRLAALVTVLAAGLAPVVASPAFAAPPPKPPPPRVYKIPFGQEMVLGGRQGTPVFRILIDQPTMKGFRARRRAVTASRLPRPINRYRSGRPGQPGGAKPGNTTPGSAVNPAPQKPVNMAEINKNRPDRAWVRFSWVAPQKKKGNKAGKAGVGGRAGKPTGATGPTVTTPASPRAIRTYEFPIYKPRHTRPLIRPSEDEMYPVTVQPGLVMVWQHTSVWRGRHYAHVRIAQDKTRKPCNPHVRLPRRMDLRLNLGPFPPREIDVNAKGRILQLAGSVHPGAPLFLNIMEESAYRCYAGLAPLLYPKDNVLLYGMGEIIVRRLSVNVVPEGMLGASQGYADLRLLPPAV